jgi:hypothetical protein
MFQEKIKYFALDTKCVCCGEYNNTILNYVTLIHPRLQKNGIRTEKHCKFYKKKLFQRR